MKTDARFVLFALTLGLALAPNAEASSKWKQKQKHSGPQLHWSHMPSIPAPIHCAPPPSCPPAMVWVPAHHETRCEKVWVEGCEQRVWVEPAFEWRYDSCGRSFRFSAGGGHWKTVRTPGHYETRTVQVWVQGEWRPTPPKC